jgi:polygalacturonase
MKSILSALLLSAVLPAVQAQDTRQVSEPKIPAAGVILPAHLTSRGGTLSDADEANPDTLRLQQALDNCPVGQAVELKADGPHDAFLTAPIELRQGVTLLIDRGVILFASRNPRDYDLRPGVAGTITEHGLGCRPLIRGTNVADTAIMGDGIIDGRGGATMLGQDLTWWQLAAKGRPHALQNNPRLVVFANCDNAILYRIQLRNSPNFHVSYSGGNGFTVWGVIISVPGNAHNADGIDIGQPWPVVHQSTTNVTVTHCFIHAGDDIVAVKAPLGYLTSHVSVLHNHFYTGHGMSIGSATSGGVTAVLVSDLTIDGAANAFHLKSNIKLGGLIHDVEFDDVWVRNSKNPLFIETHYDSSGHEVDGDDPHHPPQFADIRFNHVHFQGGGRITLDGLDAGHRLDVTFHDVTLDRPENYKVTVDHAFIKLDGSNIPTAGEDVTVSGTPDVGEPAADGPFVPFPVPIAALPFSSDRQTY